MYTYFLTLYWSKFTILCLEIENITNKIINSEFDAITINKEIISPALNNLSKSTLNIWIMGNKTISS